MTARWTRWLDLVPLLAAAWCAWQVLDTMSARVAHPYDLEWMEGGMLVHALRLSQGRPLYPSPSAEWIPYVYPPGFAALVAAVSGWFGGVEYLPARLVSCVGTLSACAGLVRLGSLRGSWSAGALGAAAFLLTYRGSGAFFDLARPDGVAIGLLAWTLVMAVDRARGSKIAAGLLLAAAFVVKHHSAAFGLPLALAIWLREGWRSGLRFGLSALIPAVLFLVEMQARTDGRFLVFLVEVPASHPMDWERWMPGLPFELGLWMLPSAWSCAAWTLSTLPIERVGLSRTVAVAGCLAVGGAVAAAVHQLPVPEGIGVSSPWTTAACAMALGTAAATVLVHAVAARPTERPAYWTAFLVGATALVVVGLMRAHNGGFMNVLMPAHWLLAAGGVVAVADLRRALPGWSTDLAGAVLLALPLAWEWDGELLLPLRPNPEDLVAGQVVEEALRGCPEGPIFSPFAPWLVHRAGRDPGLHLIALWDVSQPKNPMRRGADAVVKRTREQGWACVLGSVGGKIGYGVEGNYVARAPLAVPPRSLAGRTGWRARPVLLMDRVPPGSRP